MAGGSLRQRRDASQQKASEPPKDRLDHNPPPHTLKNKFVLTGYRVHESPAACFETFTSFNNETLNLYTAVTGIFVGLYFAFHLLVTDSLSAASSSPVVESSSFLPNLPAHHIILLFHLVLGILNFIMTGAYHLLCSHPPLYHIASAVDLLGINLPALGMAAISSADVRLVPSSLAHVPPGYLFLGVATIILAISLYVFRVRVNLERESPMWLLALNFVPYWLMLCPVYAYVRWPHPRIITTVAFFSTGVALYVFKFPERLFPGKFCDVYFQSHSIWHTCYITAHFLVFLDACLLFTSPELSRLQTLPLF